MISLRWVTAGLLLAGCSHSSSSADAAVEPDLASAGADDGTPVRVPCTSNYGDAITQSFGRLDGYLVAIVAPGSMHGCNDDDTHVHLQVRTNGSIYDIAIDATDAQTGIDDVHTATRELALPGEPWSEGWHTGVTLDYVALGVHSTDLPLDTKAEVVSTLMTDLANANHVSVFATGYGGAGAHLVHREGSSHDGLLVSNPLSSLAHARFFSFSNLSF